VMFSFYFSSARGSRIKDFIVTNKLCILPWQFPHTKRRISFILIFTLFYFATVLLWCPGCDAEPSDPLVSTSRGAGTAGVLLCPASGFYCCS
jgi:hypothetical protein